MATSFSLFQRNNGIFYYGWREHGKRVWKSTGCKTRQSASEFIQRLTQQQSHKTNGILLSELWREFQQVRGENHTLETQISYGYAIRQFLDSCGDRDITVYESKDVESFKVSQLRTVKKISVNNRICSLVAIFNFAVSQGYITASPVRLKQRYALPTIPPSFMTPEQFKNLINHTRTHLLKDLFTFLVHTGLRISEAINLELSHVDLVNKQIHVVCSETFRTKTNQNRTIPLNAIALAILERQQRNSRYVFELNGRKLLRNYCTHEFLKARVAAELNPRIHLHSCRSTFASWLVQRSQSLYSVQQLLGHTTSRMTEKYAFLAPSQLHSVVNKLDI